MKNPVIHAIAGDPYVFREGSDYYMLDTNEGGWHAKTYDIYHSTDMQHWDGPYCALDLKDLTWVDDAAWAPGMTKHNGLYYICYTANMQIGLAVSENPLGPYKDFLGRPFITYEQFGIPTMEPGFIHDDDGKLYFYYGQGRCLIWEIDLGPDHAELIGDPVDLTEEFYAQRTRHIDDSNYDYGFYCESPDIVKYEDRYLMTWTCYFVTDPRYCVRYAWADKVTGPYIMPSLIEDENVMLKGHDKIQGTGGQNCFVDDRGELRIAYHRYIYPREGYHRELCIDHVSFLDRDRLIVIPTP